MAQQAAASQVTRQPIERNLAMELVRVTEAAAMSASVHMGKGDKELVDQAAVDAMRFTLDGVRMDGVVVIGEGEKDEAPMLYNGEHIGDGSDPKVDIAVDPIDGTTLLSKGLPGAIAVIALSARGTMRVPREVERRVFEEQTLGIPGVAELNHQLVLAAVVTLDEFGRRGVQLLARVK